MTYNDWANQDPSSQGSNGQDSGEQLVNVNWEMIPLSELTNGYMRTQDYTKKTQELADERKNLQRNWVDTWKPADPSGADDDSERKLAEWMKQKWFATQEDLIKQQQKYDQDKRFGELLDYNPSLRPFEKAIRDIAEAKGIAPEDVAEQYGFAKKDQLIDASRSRWLVGNNGDYWQKKPKSIRDLSSEDYQKWIDEQRSTGGHQKAQSF